MRAAVRGAGSRLGGGPLGDVGAGVVAAGAASVRRAYRRNATLFGHRHRFHHPAAPVERDGQTVRFTGPKRRLAGCGERNGRLTGHLTDKLAISDTDGGGYAGRLVPISTGVSLEHRRVQLHRRRRLHRKRVECRLDRGREVGTLLPLRQCQRRLKRPTIDVARLERRADERGVVRPDAAHQRESAALRPFLQEEDADLGVSVLQGEVDGLEAIEGVLDVDLGAARDEQLDRLEASLVGGEEQRGGPVACFCVDVGALVENRRHARGIARTRRVPQRLVRVGGRSLGSE